MNFDGSIHFSVQFPSDKETVLGFVWRYYDQFTHYGCKI